MRWTVAGDIVLIGRYGVVEVEWVESNGASVVVVDCLSLRYDVCDTLLMFCMVQ
jgi:hypothetical protein